MTRTWRLTEVICGRCAPSFQHLVIGPHGTGPSRLFQLTANGQSTEHSQLVYHEALLMPALLLADRVERVAGHRLG